MSITVLADPDTDTVQPDPEVLDLIANATDAALWIAEQTMIVDIAAGVDVDAAAFYLDVIHEEQGHRENAAREALHALL